MKALIIEDEKPAARRLQRMLGAQGVETLDMLHSVEESLAWFQEHQHPDLLFLDIQLSDGLSFEIFEHTTINSSIIFTTAYDEYALKAFKLNSIDYLLKPIDEDELTAAIQKYKQQQKPQQVEVDFEDIRQLLINPVDRKYKKRFSIKVGQHLKIIPIQEVACFYSEHKATYLNTVSGRNYLIDGALEQVYKELDPERFFRVSRTFIVEINAIKDIIAYTNSRLKIILQGYDDTEIIVSRERVKDFKNWIS